MVGGKKIEMSGNVNRTPKQQKSLFSFFQKQPSSEESIRKNNVVSLNISAERVDPTPSSGGNAKRLRSADVFSDENNINNGSNNISMEDNMKQDTTTPTTATSRFFNDMSLKSGGTSTAHLANKPSYLTPVSLQKTRVETELTEILDESDNGNNDDDEIIASPTVNILYVPEYVF